MDDETTVSVRPDVLARVGARIRDAGAAVGPALAALGDLAELMGPAGAAGTVARALPHSMRAAEDLARRWARAGPAWARALRDYGEALEAGARDAADTDAGVAAATPSLAGRAGAPGGAR